MWGAHDGMGWWMFLGSVWFVVFWGLVIWAFVSLVSPRGREPGGESALDIAKRRYARGEITKEEFEQLRRDLTG
ncbi:MAG TPA: SHOCT domain-containing protein [Dehalococcoidia bacterium]